MIYSKNYMKKYNPQKIEKVWQKKWFSSNIFAAKNGSKKPKSYLLTEFPFPSGDGLHVGHCRPYIGLDVVARKRRLEGVNVMYPMGWDAFGLPTENYAIKHGIHPTIATKKNTANFKRQMQLLGLSFDWSREVNTTDPAYYKWTQWIFIQLFKHGLAYKEKMTINWCPKDKTGLANEEVINGKCERCGTAVEKREKDQWLIKITKYADRLIGDLETVDYPQRVKDQQINWIGKSEGAMLKFEIRAEGANQNSKSEIEVFTTRPDTLFGCTFLVVAPEHPITQNLESRIQNLKEVTHYISQAKNKSDLQRQEEKEKTGVELKGVKAINPATGAEVPIFVADYVLVNYGTGAIMAVPAHDERDFAFAKKYALPVKEVVIPNIIDRRNPPIEGKKFVERQNVHAIVRDPETGNYLGLKWKKFDWTTFPMGGVEQGENVVEAAKREIKEETGFTNVVLKKILPGSTRAEYFAAHKDENRISYTTAVVFDLAGKEQVEVSQKEKDAHAIIWLDANSLDYEHMTHAEIGHWTNQLAEDNYVYTGDGYLVNSGKFDGKDSKQAKAEITKSVGGIMATTYKLRDWIFSRQHYWGEPIPMVNCVNCGWVPVSEKELPIELPKVKKYEPTDNGESPLSAIETWVNVICPSCGKDAKRETDTMPNWAGSNWYYLAYTVPGISNFKFQISNSAKNISQWMPVDWYNGGMEHTTLHLLYSRFIFKFLWDIGAVPKQIGNEPYKRRTSHGIILGPGEVKMSKSRGNVINPDDVVKQYGADTLRVYEMFMGPFEQMIPWDDKGIVGARRFLERVYILAQTKVSKASDKNLQTLLNKTIKKVGDDIEEMKFNTAVSAMMQFVNEWNASEIGLDKKDTQKFLAILSPFAPHLASELGLAKEVWPKHEIVQEETVMMVISVNGKVRDKMEMKSGLAQKAVEELVLTSPKIKPWLEGKEVRKVIFVPNKLINFVV